jgi:hypothetical protein
MTKPGRLALVSAALLLGGAAAGKSAPQRAGSAKRLVSEQALKHLECVTRWEQVCAADPARLHLLEVEHAQVKYLPGANAAVDYAILGRSRKLLQLAPPGSRRAVASLKLEKDGALYTGPTHVPESCLLPKCAVVPECLPSAEQSTVHFVSETLLSQRLRELMSLVPQKQCPQAPPRYTVPQPGETCLNTGKPYSIAAAPARKKPPVSLDLQPLRLFLSSEESARLDTESKPLLETLRIYSSSRSPKTRGMVTARLHFPEGSRKPEVSIPGGGDAKLAACMGAALRAPELFSWRPSQVADLELSFVFAP